MAIKRTPSWAIVARLVVAMFVFIGGPTAQSRAAGNLECPEIGAGHVPDLIGDTTGAGLATTSSRADIVNEVNGAINRLQVADPNVSWTDVQNALTAAYCRAVADAPASPSPRSGVACGSSTGSWSNRSAPMRCRRAR